MDFELMRKLIRPTDPKILLVVMDGLGGLPSDEHGFTEMEKANTPHLNNLAKDGIWGFHQPVGPGITPGSGPSHLALFGYDPFRFRYMIWVEPVFSGCLLFLLDVGNQSVQIKIQA